MAEPARQRPLYPSEIQPLKKPAPFDGRPFAGRIDRQTDDLPSISPSKRPSLPPLSASERRLIRWIETHVPGELPRELRPFAVQHHGQNRDGFAGARTFVTRYGAELIVAALNDMTYVTSDDYYGTRRRWWLDRVVSPAQFLHYQVKQLAK